MKRVSKREKAFQPAELKPYSVEILFAIELIVAIALLTFISGCGVPSDSKLREKFFHERSNFVELVRMSNEDEHVSLIMPNFTYLDTDASWPRKDIGFRRNDGMNIDACFASSASMEVWYAEQTTLLPRFLLLLMPQEAF
jgi:hypothetical protein